MKNVLLLMTLILAAGCGQSEPAPMALETADTPAAPAAAATPHVRAEEQALRRLGLMTVEEAIKGFRVMNRRFPETLDELVKSGMIHSLPNLPPNVSFAYDAQTGAVSIVPKHDL
jgi:hypothetical protein